MKSHTSLEQSKMLAEFLSIDSADMCFNTRNNMPPLMTPYSRFNEFFNMEPTPDFLIPCWSLAALLDLLPLEIETHNQTDGCKVYYYVELYMKHMGKEIYLSTERYESLVDACYEMILKLHEQNLL